MVLCSWGLGHYNWQKGANRDNNNDAGMRAALALRLVNVDVGPCDSDPCAFPSKCIETDSDSYKCVMEKVFETTGKVQSFVVPEGISSVEVLLYGAGGGGGDVSQAKTSNAAGGGGGFTSGVLQTTPKETLAIIVGQVTSTCALTPVLNQPVSVTPTTKPDPPHRRSGRVARQQDGVSLRWGRQSRIREYRCWAVSGWCVSGWCVGRWVCE